MVKNDEPLKIFYKRYFVFQIEQETILHLICIICIWYVYAQTLHTRYILNKQNVRSILAQKLFVIIFFVVFLFHWAYKPYMEIGGAKIGWFSNLNYFFWEIEWNELNFIRGKGLQCYQVLVCDFPVYANERSAYI